MPIKIRNRGLCNLLHRHIKGYDCSWLRTPEPISLPPREKVLPSPLQRVPIALLASTLAIRCLHGHLDQCCCGSLPACMISNGSREQTQKGSGAHSSMLWLGLQTCWLCEPNRFLRGALGCVNPAVKARIWRLSHCQLESSSDVVVWWHCKI